jgi:aspartate aminotransferase
VQKPAGAFYLFVDVSDFLSPDGIRTTAELAQALLDEARVALTPGEAFDAPGFIRISYATSLGELHRGSERLLQFFRSVEHRGRAAAGA